MFVFYFDFILFIFAYCSTVLCRFLALAFILFLNFDFRFDFVSLLCCLLPLRLLAATFAARAQIKLAGAVAVTDILSVGQTPAAPLASLLASTSSLTSTAR